MKMPQPTCSQCSAPLGDGALAGQCPRCLGLLAFGAETELTEEILHRTGDYEFIRELGRGGMGVVYEARQISLNRRVAVKMLLNGAFGPANLKPRFQAEAGAAARLRHPNIVTIHEIGELDGQPFFAMELIEGPSFADLAREKPLPGKRAARYLRLVAEAIAHAHAEGVWHRDLKPSNVIVDAGDQPKVTDFGLAKQLDSASDLTRTGEVFGSPNYLPPEQVSGGQFGPEGDIYSLGAILYQLLTTRPPFVADTVAATLQQALHAEPMPPRQANPSVPRDLEIICLKCLRKEPGRRYSRAIDLAADLGRFENSQPIHARPTSMVGQWILWSRRKPVLAALVTALILTLIGGFSGVLWQWQQARSSRDEMGLNLYAADLAAAANAVRQGNLGIARALLEPYAMASRTDSGRNNTSDLRGFEWRLLWQQCQSSELATLGSQEGRITIVAVSPDGQWVASGSENQAHSPDPTLKIWNLPRREFVTALQNAGSIESLAFTSDSRLLISAGSHGIRFWEIPSGTEVEHEHALEGQTASLAPEAQVLVFSPWHPTGKPTPDPISVYDLRTKTSRVLPAAGWFPTISADGRKLAFLDARWDIQLWDLTTSKFIRTVATNRLLYTLRFSPDGRYLAAAGRMTHARVWDLNQAEQAPQLFPHERNVWLADFSPDGKILVTTSSDQVIRLWHLAHGEVSLELRGHGNEVRTAAFTGDSQFLVSGGKDQTVRLWSTQPPPSTFKAKQNENTSPLFSPDGSLFVSYVESQGKPEATVWKWNGPADFATNRSATQNVASNGVDVSAPRKIVVIPGYPRGFAPDGRHVLVYKTMEPSLEWWLPNERGAAKIVRLAEAPGDLRPDQSGVSGDGATFFLGNSKGDLWLWDTTTGKLRRQFSFPSERGDHTNRRRFTDHFFSSLAMDREGRILAVSSYSDHAILICDVATSRVQRMTGHRDWSPQVVFSPDGRTLASGSVDGTIRLWDVATARELATLPGHLEETSAVAFSPDGNTLASLNQGLEMKLWHLPTRRELAVFSLLRIGARLAFSPDGSRLAMNDVDGHVIVWDAPFVR